MQKITRIHLRRFLEKYSTNVPILDIGSGSTEYSHLFPNRTTLDIDPARKPDIVGDAENLPFADDSYEVILCSEVFEHLRRPHQVVAEMRRVLKPGGTLILTTRFMFPVHDAPDDFFRYTQYGLKYLFKEWDIQHIESEADPFTTLAIIIQRMMIQSDFHGGKVTKLFLYSLMRLFMIMRVLTAQSYGNVQKTRREESQITSGLYLVCSNTKKH